MPKRATPADVIREVISRTCGKSVRDRDNLASDLKLSANERTELLSALELALHCEAGDIQPTDDLTVSDLIAILRDRAA
jgi:hypothetical protein